MIVIAQNDLFIGNVYMVQLIEDNKEFYVIEPKTKIKLYCGTKEDCISMMHFFKLNYIRNEKIFDFNIKISRR